MMQNKFFLKNVNKFLYPLLIFFLFLPTGCGKFKPVSVKDTPTNAMERAKKNVEEGRGVAIGNVFGGGKGTNYEFSTSNPMWRASLEALDFMPLSVVDYSGGIIISDWYGNEKNESLKITIRFLSNEVRSDSLKIIVYQKKCSPQKDCFSQVLNSQIKDELTAAIIKKAAVLEKEIKKK